MEENYEDWKTKLYKFYVDFTTQFESIKEMGDFLQYDMASYSPRILQTPDFSNASEGLDVDVRVSFETLDEAYEWFEYALENEFIDEDLFEDLEDIIEVYQ